MLPTEGNISACWLRMSTEIDGAATTGPLRRGGAAPAQRRRRLRRRWRKLARAARPLLRHLRRVRRGGGIAPGGHRRRAEARGGARTDRLSGAHVVVRLVVGERRRNRQSPARRHLVGGVSARAP